MEKKLLVHLNSDELKAIVDKSISDAILKMPIAKKEDNELLTRADVALMFKVSYVTVNAWCRSGKLKAHRMNSRVYFLKSEIMEELLKRKK